MPRVDDLSDTCGQKLSSLENENTSAFDQRNKTFKVFNKAPAVDKTDSNCTKIMEMKPLLKACGI